MRRISQPEAEGLSSSTITRLKATWWEEYEAWRKRDLKAKRYVYIWADGVYFTPRLDGDRQCMLVIIGADEYGEKDVLAIMDGFRENVDSWRDLLKRLKKRGLTVPPELAIGDGALGFWTALREVFPNTREQRCWVHKTANVLGAMPKSLHDKAKADLQDIWMAETKKEATAAFDLFVETYGVKYEKAVGKLVKDRDELLAFYDFPAEHWKHIRTTNPIESVFATVRNRTRKTKGCLNRKTALAMVFRLMMSAKKKWRKINGPNRLPEVIQGVVFKDGVKQLQTGAYFRPSPTIGHSTKCRLTYLYADRPNHGIDCRRRAGILISRSAKSGWEMCKADMTPVSVSPADPRTSTIAFFVQGRSLIGQDLKGTCLLDYVNWVDDGVIHFRAFFARGTDPAVIRAADGMTINNIRSIGEGLLVEGVDAQTRAPTAPFPVCSGSPIETGLFDGLNTILALRNGETAEVLQEWLAYHVEHHDVQAVLIVDRARDPKALPQVLRSDSFAIPGLERVVVLSAPIPLGARYMPPEAHPFCAPAAPGKDRMEVPEPDPWTSPLGEFLIFEIARTRFLDKARAVVAIDVHDLLLPHDGQTVFDRAQDVAAGVIPLQAMLTYPWRVRKDDTPRFRDHICMQFDGEKAKRRWCIAPQIAGPDVVWRPSRIVGPDVDPAQTETFVCCINMRHPTSTVSQIVPKSSLIESDQLIDFSESYLGGNAVRAPELEVNDAIDDDDQSVVVVTCMKNEGPFILEWLAYHRMIGIKNFIVYTNDCDDGTDTFLDLLQAKGYLQHRDNPFRSTGLKPQHAALESSAHEDVVKNAAWAISMDVDEFICIHVGDGTLKSLFDAVPDANMISLTWRLFGNADVADYKDELVTRQFTRCAREFANKPHQAWGFKTLFRQNGIFKKLGVHRPKGLHPQLKDALNWVNGSGQPMPEKSFRNAWRSTSDTYGYNLVSLNHYAVRSAESFLVKRDRGRVNHVDRDQGLAYWFRMNNNEEENTSILRMTDRLQAEMDRLLQDPDIVAQHTACVQAHRAKIDALKSTQSFTDFFEEITGERMRRLSRMHRHFGANVFLSGPTVIPDEVVFAEHEDNFFFTVQADASGQRFR